MRNKWCPVIKTESSQTKCMGDECAWYYNSDCVIFSILDKLDDIDSKISYVDSNTGSIEGKLDEIKNVIEIVSMNT